MTIEEKINSLWAKYDNSSDNEEKLEIIKSIEIILSTLEENEIIVKSYDL